MKLSEFITATSTQIISEWEEFARTCLRSASTMNLEQRRDHVAGMLRAIVVDIDTPQTVDEQADKSQGKDDADVDADTAANAHGVDRAAIGYTAIEIVAEFRALRASVLRLWSEAQPVFTRENLEEVLRFNEGIDQALAESMARYAEEIARSKDLFLGVLGHDLKNPIGSIAMSVTVMMRKEGPAWAHVKSATRILTSCSRMEGIVGDLLDFTRSHLGAGIPIVRADMDLEVICRETVEEITSFHPGCVVKLAATGQLHGQWDRGRLGQALSNLVGNAYQHGSENCAVEVSARGEVERVVLTVHNQGPAIPRDELQNIFSPFRQVDPAKGSSASPSVGLGLYIAQAIVTAHHGTIEVDSSARGTTFTVSLPRAA